MATFSEQKTPPTVCHCEPRSGVAISYLVQWQGQWCCATFCRLSLFFLFCAPGLAQAQTPRDQLYQLYISSATPDYYKRAIAHILKIAEPQTSTFKQSASTASGSPITTQGVGPTPQTASADPTFLLRDFYIFPNPAKRNQKPTIRIQVGLADSVDVNIYDISGERVHSVNLSSPQALDDGNGKGSQYTFDYSWDTSHVGSGIYVVAITAHKAGQADIRAIKKAGVIR